MPGTTRPPFVPLCSTAPTPCSPPALRMALCMSSTARRMRICLRTLLLCLLRSSRHTHKMRVSTLQLSLSVYCCARNLRVLCPSLWSISYADLRSTAQLRENKENTPHTAARSSEITCLHCVYQTLFSSASLLTFFAAFLSHFRWCVGLSFPPHTTMAIQCRSRWHSATVPLSTGQFQFAILRLQHIIFCMTDSGFVLFDMGMETVFRMICQTPHVFVSRPG